MKTDLAGTRKTGLQTHNLKAESHNPLSCKEDTDSAAATCAGFCAISCTDDPKRETEAATASTDRDTLPRGVVHLSDALADVIRRVNIRRGEETVRIGLVYREFR